MKKSLYFINDKDCALAARLDSHTERIKTALQQSSVFSEVSNPKDADAIIIFEQFSYKDWRYIKLLKEDSIIGAYPHKTYTINYDDSATGLLRGLYTSLPMRRFDEQIHRIVPYISSPNALVGTTDISNKSQPVFLASWRGNSKSNPIRHKLVASLSTNARFKIETTESWMNHSGAEKERYIDLIASSKFSLCPAGWAPVSFRIYESMILGCSPVIIADQFVPPTGPDWPRFSIRISEYMLDQINDILSEYEDDYKVMGNLAKEEWQRNFGGDKVYAYYAQKMVDCITSSKATFSKSDEMKRWYSGAMFRGNNWTLGQRLRNRVSKYIHFRL